MSKEKRAKRIWRHEERDFLEMSKEKRAKRILTLHSQFTLLMTKDYIKDIQRFENVIQKYDL